MCRKAEKGSRTPFSGVQIQLTSESKSTLERVLFMIGGEIGIRTPGTRKGTIDFESTAFDHSAISPMFHTLMLFFHKNQAFFIKNSLVRLLILVYNTPCVQGVGMTVKEYRVVCSQEKETERVFVDIVPSGGAIHELILFARQKLNKSRSPYEVKDIGKSIYLRTEGDNLQIDFCSFDKMSQDDPKYARLQILKGKLRPLIVDEFKRMQKSGLSSTINVSSPALMQEFYNVSRESVTAQMEQRKLALERKIVTKRWKEQHQSLYAKEEPLERYKRLYYEGYC